MDNKKQFLTEENYNNTNSKVKKIGNVLIIIGLTLIAGGFIITIASFLGFSGQITNGMEIGQEGINPGMIFSNIGGLALGGFIISPGLFIAVIGLIVRFIIGNRREITAYTTQQTMPITQEKIEKMAPTVGSAVGTIGKELVKGIKEGIKEVDENK